MINTFAQGYLIVGALLTVVVYGMNKRWPTPIEVVVGLLFWPVAIALAVKGAWKELDNETKRTPGPAKPNSQGGDPHPPSGGPGQTS